MMRTLSLERALQIYARTMAQSGGSVGVRDLGVLESALNQPFLTFSGEELYPSLAEKAATIGFSVIRGHPFVDGNKRAGYMFIEAFLAIHGFELQLDVDEHEAVILSLAAGELDRDEFTEWVRSRIVPRRT